MNLPIDESQRHAGEMLTQAEQQLLSCSESPRLDAEILLALALEIQRSQFFARPELPVSAHDQARFQQLLERRLRGEPIAHILGQREFWSLPLAVTPATLIPRPDTELLVELALARIPNDAVYEIADLGTGTGAIALAVASERPRCHILATDLSEEALEVARSNARNLQLNNVRFQHGDWFQPLGTAHFDLILSNPPYIPSDDPHLALGDVRFEPYQALVSGADGLDALRYIVEGAVQHLRPGGWLLVEHGYDQGAAVADLFARAGFADISTVKDFGGQPRVSLGQYSQ